jgi:single-strand DNA-binding protein
VINRVVLVGRLTKDPELRYTPSGVPMTRFTVAVNRTFSNQQGEREADFIGCVAWRKQAENLANFMKKGSLIGVEGRIQTGSFEGQDGKRVYTTDVVADSVQFLEPRNSGGGSGMPNLMEAISLRMVQANRTNNLAAAIWDNRIHLLRSRNLNHPVISKTIHV